MDHDRGSESRSAAEAAIRALEAAYDSAWNVADLKKLTSLFARGATIIDPFGGVSAGRAEIEGLFATLFAGAGRGSMHASTVLGVRFVTDGVALLDGEAVIEGLKDPGGHELPVLVHRFTDVLVGHDDAWRIAAVRAYVLMDGPRP
jgi:uncharacterized protein (TIGR02246 family)